MKLSYLGLLCTSTPSNLSFCCCQASKMNLKTTIIKSKMYMKSIKNEFEIFENDKSEIYKNESEIETYLKSPLKLKMTNLKSTKIYLKLIPNLKSKTYLTSTKKKMYLKATKWKWRH